VRLCRDMETCSVVCCYMQRDMLWHVVWYVVTCGVVCCDMRCGMLWHAVWYVVTCGVVYCDMFWYVVTWCSMSWYDVVCYDMVWYILRHDVSMLWYGILLIVITGFFFLLNNKYTKQNPSKWLQGLFFIKSCRRTCYMFQYIMVCHNILSNDMVCCSNM